MIGLSGAALLEPMPPQSRETFALARRWLSGKEEEVAARLEALVLASRSDPGVTIYDPPRSTEDPALWLGFLHAPSSDSGQTLLEAAEEHGVGIRLASRAVENAKLRFDPHYINRPSGLTPASHVA
jgi:hypothetical protein